MKMQSPAWLKWVEVKELSLFTGAGAWHAENILLNFNPGDFSLSGNELEFQCNVCVARCSNLPLLTAYE